MMRRLLAVLMAVMLLAPNLAQASDYALSRKMLARQSRRRLRRQFANPTLWGQSEARVTALFGIAHVTRCHGPTRRHQRRPAQMDRDARRLRGGGGTMSRVWRAPTTSALALSMPSSTGLRHVAPIEAFAPRHSRSARHPRAVLCRAVDLSSVPPAPPWRRRFSSVSISTSC